jgi:hypothetical protein
MTIDLELEIKTAVANWLQKTTNYSEPVIYVFADEEEYGEDEDGNEDDRDDGERFIAVFAARELTQWQAVEVWIENGLIASINDLGEGAPPEGVVWPF